MHYPVGGIRSKLAAGAGSAFSDERNTRQEAQW